MADKKNAIIFDMDGTLWDSAEQVAVSWSIVTRVHPLVKKDMTKADLQSVMGLTMDKIAERLFPEVDLDERLRLLNECCKVENDYVRKSGGVLYDGVEPVFGWLKNHGYFLCIVSNCQSGYIEAFLDYYDLWKYIDDIECFGNNDKPKAENISLVVERNGIDNAVYLGDIQGDCDSADKAGVGFIHAAYGFGTINRPVPKINKLSELPQVVESIFA